MAKTIDLNSYSDYSQIKTNTVEYLKKSNLDIMEAMINLAMAKEWSDWNKTKTEGTIFNFNEQMLGELNDPNINELLRLKEFTEDVLKKITKG